MDCKICPVSLDRIETAENTFQITTTTDKADLAASIRAIGLLQPPVLIKKGGFYTVVCGYRRIAACEALNITSIAARVLPPDTSPVNCVRIAISDNTFQRPLNVVEQSRAFALIRRFVDSSTSWLKIAESTGMPASQKAMDRIMPVAGMPAILQDAILYGSIALPVALTVSRLEKNDADALCGFFSTINTGLNIQRELLELILEISRRDDISIARLMKRDDIMAVIENDDSSSPQKTREVRVLLKAERYPELSKAEAVYLRKVKSLKLSPLVQFQPPQFFEGKSYRLTLTVNSRRQLQSLQTELEKLVHHPDLLPQ